MLESFKCTACGAPVIAEPGAEAMACPYCNSMLSIPPEFRRGAQKLDETPPSPSRPLTPLEAAARVRLDDATRERSLREAEMLANGLRRAQPIASAALRHVQPIASAATRLYNQWVLARRYLPGCISALVILCLLGCAAIVALVVYFRFLPAS
jgi:hypothetical protein